MDVNLSLGISTSGNRLGGFGNIPRSTLNPIAVEPEFEPEVHWKETPENHILVANLPGFTSEDVRVHIDNWGNLVISGERRVEELVMVGGRMHKMERLGGYRFRKIFGFPAKNLNFEGVTAKFEHGTLYVWLPKFKAKPSADADFESRKLPDEERPEAKHDEISEAISTETSSPYESEFREETEQQEDAGGKTPESWRPSQEINLQAYADNEIPEEENWNVLEKEGKDIDIVEVKEDEAGCLPPPLEEFPEERIQNHANSSTSIFSKRRVRIATTVAVASTVVIISVGLYLSYKFSSSSTEDYSKLQEREGI